MENEVYEAIHELVKQINEDNNNQTKLETKVGMVVPKSQEYLEQVLDFWKNTSIQLDKHISKGAYRFEPSIGELDFKHAQNNLKCDRRWDFTIDLIFDINREKKNTYRMGIDADEKMFCYQRIKELKSAHIDIMDKQRMYRVSLTANEQLDKNNDYQLIQKKLLCDINQNGLPIICCRYKETQIYHKEGNFESFVFRVQQADKKNQEFLHGVVDCICDTNMSFQENIQNVLKRFQEKKHYFKYFYEAEFQITPDKSKSLNQQTQLYLEQIRDFHDKVRLFVVEPDMQGLKYKKSEKKQYQEQKHQKQRGRQRFKGY